jgi:hypothetical protein
VARSDTTPKVRLMQVLFEKENYFLKNHMPFLYPAKVVGHAHITLRVYQNLKDLRVDTRWPAKYSGHQSRTVKKI